MQHNFLGSVTISPAATCVNDVSQEPATRVSATPGAQSDSSKPALGLTWTATLQGTGV